MQYETEDLARTLKAARVSKGLSQRALGRKAGLALTGEVPHFVSKASIFEKAA